MKSLSRSILFFASVLFIFSCNKIPNHAKYIPKDAIGVFSVDAKQLSKKLIWNALTGSELFDEMQKDIKNEESKKAMKDFSNLGLDPLSTIYFFYTGDMQKENHPCIIIGMKDASKFESFISKNYPEIKVESNDQYKSCQVENKFLVSWNKEALIATMLQADYNFDNDSMQITYDAAPANTYLKELYSLTAANAITEIKNFKKLQGDGHDFALWVNYEELYKKNASLSDPNVKAFMKDEYLKDAALACGFDFEKGAVDMDMDYFFSKELGDIYRKNEAGSVDESLLKNIPSKDIAFLMSYNIKPKMIEDFLKEFKLDGLANLGLASLGLSMDAILGAFKGDIVFAISDLKSKTVDTNTMAYSGNTPDFNFVYAMTLNDPSKLEALLDKGVKQSIVVKNGNTYTLANSAEGVLIYDKEKFVYSNKPESAKQFMEAKGNAKESVPSEAWSKITGNPIALFADIKKIIAAMPMEAQNEEEKLLIEELKSMFTYAQLYGGKMKGNANHMEGNLFFTNKDENSMIQLIRLGIKVNKMQEKKNLNMSTPAADTLEV